MDLTDWRLWVPLAGLAWWWWSGKGATAATTPEDPSTIVGTEWALTSATVDILGLPWSNHNEWKVVKVTKDQVMLHSGELSQSVPVPRAMWVAQPKTRINFPGMPGGGEVLADYVTFPA